MLDLNDYQLPEPPSANDYESQQAMAAAIRTWQNQAQREWGRLLRGAQHESSNKPFLVDFNATVRAIVLIIVVLAIVIMPIIALLTNTLTNSFSQYIAPVTGIGGVIIGYWFGQTKEGSPPARMPGDH